MAQQTYTTKGTADRGAKRMLAAGKAPAPTYTVKQKGDAWVIAWSQAKPTAKAKEPEVVQPHPAAKKTEEQTAAKPKAPKGNGGVLDIIERMLLKGKVSVADIVAECAALTGREAGGLTATVKTQISRMKTTRGLIIARETDNGVSRYSARKEG